MFGLKLQELPSTDISDPLDEQGKKWLKQIVGSTLFYVRAVNNTALEALNIIAWHTTTAIKLTKK